MTDLNGGSGEKVTARKRLAPISGGSAMLRLLRPIWRRFEAAARDPEAAQRALWAEIAREAEGSPMWGERWGRSGAPPLAELPITEYADYAEAFEKAFEGSGMPTATAPIRYWAESSGTTAAKRKRFPYAGNRKQRLAAFSPMGAYLYRLSLAEPHIPALPALVLGNAGSHPPSPAGVPVGYATGYFVARMPRWARGTMAIPWEVYQRPDLWDEWAPLYAVAKDLSVAMGLSAAWLAEFYRSLLERMDGYWPYLTGRASPPLPLPPVRVPPRRVRRLREVFRGGSPTMREVWPRMPVVLSWTGASAAAQLPLLEPFLGGVRVRDNPYICTEAAITVPLYDGAEGHPLHPGATIVELLPERAEPVAENLLPSWRVEPGCDYEVFLTTVHGLIRYRLHDVVRCTGWFHRSPRLAFRSKSAFLLKVTSTAVPEDDVVRLLRGLGYRGVDDVLIGPHPYRSAFAMYVREGSDAGRLAGALDDAFREHAPTYEVERVKGIIGPVETITVPASHPMWDFRACGQAKSRYVLPTAPRDLGRATHGDGHGRT